MKTKPERQTDNKIIFGHYCIHIFHVGPWCENSYLVRHIPSNDLLLIDPGGEAPEILKTIHKENGDLRLILLTHAHHDHMGAVKQICEHFELPYFLHSSEIRLLKRVPLYAMSLENRVVEISDNYGFLGEKKLQWCGDAIKFLHLPGHTEGGVCYYFDGIAFTGDTLLNRRIGRTDLPGACAGLLNNSITKLLNELPDNTILFPGHGESWNLDEARSWWKISFEAPPEHREH